MSTGQKYIISASVDSVQEEILKRKSCFMFAISVTWSNGATWQVIKSYKEFFDMQCSLLDMFPVESGRRNKERTIPFLPGRQLFRRDDMNLACERRPLLDMYVKQLVSMEPRISRSKLVLDFFEEEKIEGQYNIEDTEECGKEQKDVTQSINNLTMEEASLGYVNTSFNKESDDQL